jgi:phytoene synthase
MGIYHATEEDYRRCKEILKASSKTFFLSSKILPPEKERAFWAVYAFCRKTDDIADEGELAGEERIRRLGEWKGGLKAACLGKKSSDPVMRAFADTARRHSIPISYPLVLVSGVSKDARPFRFNNFTQLRRYCYSVASVVGLMLLCVMGARSKKARRHAVYLGIGMQLTNIIRDIEEDSRSGRVYLPEDELRAYGLSREDVGPGMGARKKARFKRLLRFQICRARHYYEQAVEGISLLPKELRFAIASCASLYSKILDEIEKRDCEVFGKGGFSDSRT